MSEHSKALSCSSCWATWRSAAGWAYESLQSRQLCGSRHSAAQAWHRMVGAGLLTLGTVQNSRLQGWRVPCVLRAHARAARTCGCWKKVLVNGCRGVTMAPSQPHGKNFRLKGDPQSQSCRVKILGCIPGF